MKLKSWWCFLGVCLSMCAGETYAQSARGVIAFVDFEQIFTNYFKTKLSNDQLQEMSDAINREQAKMLLQYDLLQKDFKDLRDKALSEDLIESDRAEYRKDLDARLIEIRRHEEKIKYFNETQQKRWEEQNKRIRGELVDELRRKIGVYGKARGFVAVLDGTKKNEQGVPSALYFDPENDVTADAIKYVNEY